MNLLIYIFIGESNDNFIGKEIKIKFGEIMKDQIADIIIEVLSDANEPLQTKQVVIEVKETVKTATRTKVFYRLNNLRGEGKIKGKRLIAGARGIWIWWI